MAQGRGHPQPGDLIEIFRPLCQHWAIYVGDGYVIHVDPHNTDDGEKASWYSIFPVPATRAKVKKELLTKVAGIYKWRVNNKYDGSRTPFPVAKIIQSAEEWVGKEVPHNVICKNCEHLVTKLRYGKARSEQVEDAAVGGAIAAGLTFLAGAAVLAVTALLKQ